MPQYFLGLIMVMGAFFLVFSLLCLLYPRALKGMEEWGRRPILTEQALIEHRYLVGGFLLLVSLALFILAYTL